MAAADMASDALVEGPGHGAKSEFSAFERVAILLVLARAVAGLAVWAVRGTYVRFIADDYCSAVDLAALGFWGSQAKVWHSWSGRYSFSFINNAIHLAGPRATPALPLFTLLVWTFVAIALVWFIASFWLGVKSPLAAGALGASIVYASVDGAPAPFQSFLWQTGIGSYALPLVVLTATAAVIVASTRSSTTVGRITGVLAAAVGALLSGGFSETILVAQIAFAAVVVVLTGGRLQRLVAIALGASLLSMAIVLASPGNAVRRSYFPKPKPLAQIIVPTASKTYDFIVVNAAGGGKSLVAVLLVSMLLGTAAAISEQSALRIVTGAVAIALATALAATFTGIAIVSGPPPPRAMADPYFFLVVSAAGVGVAIGATIGAQRFTRPSICLAALLVSIYGASSERIWRKGIPDVRRLATISDASRALFERSRGKRVALSAPEQLFGLDYITPDPDHWANRCVADYYGLASVRASSDGADSGHEIPDAGGESSGLEVDPGVRHPDRLPQNATQ